METYQLKSEKCSGGKLSKVRTTGMASADAAGDKLPMFLPCRYRHQKKSWMDGILYEEWVRELDWKFLPEGRNVALMIDNCSAHPHIENLKAIK